MEIVDGSSLPEGDSNYLHERCREVGRHVKGKPDQY
jgi:hypothetical protein